MNNYLYDSTVDKSVIKKTDRIYSLDDFEPYNFNGRFVLKYADINWECLYLDGVKDRLVVILNGAYDRPDWQARFNRWTFQDIFKSCFISIEDPMYAYFHIPTGWYYGDRNHDYCRYVADIIEGIRLKLGIEKVLFYSSSAGGTASIRVASILHYGDVMAFCPQLDILCYREKSIKAIESIIGVSVNEDYLKRNEHIMSGMKAAENSAVNYVLFENLSSDIDEEYAMLMSDAFGKKMRLGVNYLSDNVLMWTYHANDGLMNAHTAQDYRALVPSLLDICSEYFNDNRISQRDVQNLNMLWYDRFCNMTRINMLSHKANVMVLDKTCSLDLAGCDVIQNCVLERRKSPYNWWKYPLKNKRVYAVDVLCESDDTDEFSIVLYDFQHTLRLYHRTGRIGEIEKICFITGDNGEDGKDIAFLIYAGKHGDTCDKRLIIKEMIVRSSLIGDVIISDEKR